jgi:LemA protein
VLTAVVEARAKATQIKVDASDLTDPDKQWRLSSDNPEQWAGAQSRRLSPPRNAHCNGWDYANLKLSL